MKKERFEAFTDAVIAIVLTILVLELHLPNNDHSWQALVNIAPNFLAYIFTFLFISIMWVKHHYLFLKVKTINNATLWLNIALLFWTSLLPATTAWMGSDLHSRVAAILYTINFIFYNISFAFLRRNVTHLTPEIDTRQSLEWTSLLEWISFLINLVTLLTAYFLPPFVFVGISINILIWAATHFTNYHN